MAMAMVVPRYTAEEVRNFPDDRLRYEVIRGELFVSPAPGTAHQRAVGDLFRLLTDYVERHALGEVFVAPFEVEFTEDSATQPDVIVLLKDRARRLTSKRIQGAPSLAVEVISYSSKRTDRLQKRALYLEEGVEEYWVVDPEQRRVERWRPAAAEAEALTKLLVWEPVGRARSFELDLIRFFARVWR